MTPFERFTHTLQTTVQSISKRFAEADGLEGLAVACEQAAAEMTNLAAKAREADTGTSPTEN